MSILDQNHQLITLPGIIWNNKFLLKIFLVHPTWTMITVIKLTKNQKNTDKSAQRFMLHTVAIASNSNSETDRKFHLRNNRNVPAVLWIFCNSRGSEQNKRLSGNAKCSKDDRLGMID